ncbi:MAG: hypothetical protein J4415_03060 [Candidatus Diapherotrites archaeon]|uniref:Uncharacterized protein n=1 Tax=Candidatus Iainarchaeum sp. TaxID=3101447 RepID=A0A8T4L3G2_9ARCH|nr:hypothetical protein [Candidatus Diapherotrites archaeon]
MAKKFKRLGQMDKLLKDSTLSEEDAEAIGHKIKAEIRKRFSKSFST